MKKIITLLSLLFGIFACVKSDKLPAIHLDNISKIDPKYEIPLDSIVERTEIIRLTSDGDLLIGKIEKVLESKNNYFLADDDLIYRFNKTGKLLNTIGRKGKGPGEYLSPGKIDADEANQHLYVMDYLGRKMLRYNFDGQLDTKFNLPDKFAINDFRLYNGRILYTSEANSVNPEIYLYDQTKGELMEVSACDREMAAGEAFMGISFVLGDIENPLLFHYFNDTVFKMEGAKLIPNHLLKFGRLKIKFDELVVEKGKSTGLPRAQVYKMFRGRMFTFVQYGVSNYQEKRSQTYLTGLYRNDLSSFSPNVNLISKESPLFSICSGTGFDAGFGNTLLKTVPAYEVSKLDPNFDISENDNPILLKYYLR